jgi:hypothetical protein
MAAMSAALPAPARAVVAVALAVGAELVAVGDDPDFAVELHAATAVIRPETMSSIVARPAIVAYRVRVCCVRVIVVMLSAVLSTEPAGVLPVSRVRSGRTGL